MYEVIYLIIAALGALLALVDFIIQFSLYSFILFCITFISLILLLFYIPSGEASRKTIHLLCCFTACLLYYSFGLKAALLTISALVFMGAYLISKVEHIKDGTLRYLALKFSRRGEKLGLCALNLATGVLLTFIAESLVSIEYSALSIVVAGVGDIAASLAGKYFGRHKVREKTIEGALAAFISALLVAFPVQGYRSLLLAFAVSLAELFSPLDDNIILPPLAYVVLVFLKNYEPLLSSIISTGTAVKA
ncbi:MAG: hypothetical protein DRJ63_08270 [Thermoprotei archaeon]|nr:MAG: hypothetical protein DRJ63_08270 [Thermoprotei archaeon]